MDAKYGKYRAPWHDYTRKGFYHITLHKHPDAGAFGQMAGDWRIEDGRWGAPHVRATAIGRAIKQALRELKDIHPALLNKQYALMPDHLHILLGVAEDLDEHLGLKIAELKHRINRLAGTIVFEPDYHDHILMDDPMVKTVKKYINDNARRAVMRRAFPDFFSRSRIIVVDGAEYLTYGNIFLLDNPLKALVLVHRADDEKTKKDNKARWEYAAANGGVLVSPFIGPHEKEARDSGIDVGARIIKIHPAPFGPREKPTGRDFDLCAQGRLLYITPKQEISVCRENCLFMNGIAEKITKGNFTLR